MLIGGTVSKASMEGCVPVASTDPLYILYTSGTTGAPKGIVRDHGVTLSPQVEYEICLRSWTRRCLLGSLRCGLVVGHFLYIYGPLLHGCTTVIYEGKSVGTPDPGAFWRVVSEHQWRCFLLHPLQFERLKGKTQRENYQKIRSLSFEISLHCGRETGSGYLLLGERVVEKACNRSLVANRNRMARCFELYGIGTFSHKSRVSHQARTRISGGNLGQRRWDPSARDRRDCWNQTTPSSRMSHDLMEKYSRFKESYLDVFPDTIIRAMGAILIKTDISWSWGEWMMWLPLLAIGSRREEWKSDC